MTSTPTLPTQRTLTGATGPPTPDPAATTTSTVPPLPIVVEDAAIIALHPDRRTAWAVCAATLRWAADVWDDETPDQWLPADPVSAWLHALADEVTGQRTHVTHRGWAS